MGEVMREVWVAGPDGPVLDRVETIQVEDEPAQAGIHEQVRAAAVQALASTTLASSTKQGIAEAVADGVVAALGGNP